MYLNNVWNPALSVNGINGLPPCESAGNVLRHQTEFRVGIRLPPTVDSAEAKEKFLALVTGNPLHDAKISVTGIQAGNGWCMKELDNTLQTAFDQASIDFYGIKSKSAGIGGSIPFLSELGRKFPTTQIIATGILGPGHNAHNPDENMNIPYTRQYIKSMAHILACYDP